MKDKKFFTLTADYIFGHDLLNAAKRFFATNQGNLIGDRHAPEAYPLIAPGSQHGIEAVLVQDATPTSIAARDIKFSHALPASAASVLEPRSVAESRAKVREGPIRALERGMRDLGETEM